MMRLRYDIGKRKEGVARLEFANVITLYILGRTIMINNTSLQNGAVCSKTTRPAVCQ